MNISEQTCLVGIRRVKGSTRLNQEAKIHQLAVPAGRSRMSWHSPRCEIREQLPDESIIEAVLEGKPM